jgi:transcriptional regulator with GAF, ATPase, and Fis domain
VDAAHVDRDVAPVRADFPDVVPMSELKQRERANILAALERCHGKIYGSDGAAALLGMKPTTLSSRLRRLDR